RVLLAVVGSSWGDARFTTGKNKGRLRLDDEDDWVRQEICAAVRRGTEKIRVIVVLIDDAVLPETEWNCELDQLHQLQHARIRNQEDFERDLLSLCGWLEQQVPELRVVRRDAEAARRRDVFARRIGYRPDPYFKGRQSELEQLVQGLKEKKS